jgi:beta-lactamase superfamily II metal-dependent hydrolase
MATKPKTVNASPKTGSVTIRMFCHGLGDCFLITVGQKSGRDYAILIDCGVAMGTPGEPELMKQVVRTIAQLTNDPKTGKGHVDLLVVTHEHRDHVSGFIQAEDELKNIDFDHVWVAWTEDPKDDLANQLREKHAKEKASFARALTTAKAMATSAIDEKRMNALSGVMAFYQSIPAAKGKQVDVAAAMARASQLSSVKPPPYLMPGDLVELPGAQPGGLAAGIQAYILGPPHDGPTLRRINPTKDQETYDKAKASIAALGMSSTWAAAMCCHASFHGIGSLSADESDYERAMPFDRQARLELQALREHDESKFFTENYFESEPQRRIDGDWLWRGAQQLALYMESYTNNTSLVVAFQLPTSKKVLLFAGDAQVGNWLSWHDIKSFKNRNGATSNVTAAELLANTVFYKVGHHGSHNATLRAKGLEMMTHPELVAMIPVEAEGVKRLGYGEMPLNSLVAALGGRTEGRVLQLDKSWPDDKCPGTWKNGLTVGQLAKQSFQGGAASRPLYMEYTLKDA